MTEPVVSLETAIQDYLKEFPGLIQESTVKGMTFGYKDKRGNRHAGISSRKTTFKAIKHLVKAGLVVSDNLPIKNRHLLYLNKKNPLIMSLYELDEFEKMFVKLIKEVLQQVQEAYQIFAGFCKGHRYKYYRVYARLSDAEQLWIHTAAIPFQIFQALCLKFLASDIWFEDISHVATIPRIFHMLKLTVEAKKKLLEQGHPSAKLLEEYTAENIRQLSHAISNTASNAFDTWHFFKQCGLETPVNPVLKKMEDMTSIAERRWIDFADDYGSGRKVLTRRTLDFWEDFGARTVQVVIEGRNLWLKKRGYPLKSTSIPISYDRYVDGTEWATALDVFPKLTDFRELLSTKQKA